MSNHILTGLYLRGLISGIVSGAFFTATPLLDGVVLAVGLICAVVMLAVVLADLNKVMNEDETLRRLTEKRAPISTEIVADDDIWGNE